MTMNVGYLITARLKSTRLPQKLFKDVQGKPILAHMLDRLRLARSVDRIVICTSSLPEDKPLVQFAEDHGVYCFQGDPEDVIARLHGATAHYGFDYVLNITADCPFADPAYADRIVAHFTSQPADLIRAFDLPHGVFSYGIRPEALRRVLEVKDSTNTEVWGRYFTDTGLFDVHDLEVDPAHQHPELRMTLDYPEDLDFFRAVFAELHTPGKVFSLDDILSLLEQRPDIIALNSDCARRFQRRFVAQSAIELRERHPVSRAGVVGCGSIGQRHVRNLRELGVENVMALRSRKGHHQDLPADLGVEETSDPRIFAEFEPDIVLVTNPSSLHVQTCLDLPASCRGVFIEKPLSHELAGVPPLLSHLRERRMTSFVGFNLQFHPAIQAARRFLEEQDLGRPLSFQCAVGHWLPDWHPYEDYTKAYYALEELGGGAALTLIHEIHLAVDLLGPGQTVFAVLQRAAELSIDVESQVDLLVTHRGGAVSQIHLDFLQRKLCRNGFLSCCNGWVRYDLVDNIVEGQTATDSTPRVLWQQDTYDWNQSYLAEMQLFLRYVREGRQRHEFDAWRSALSLGIVDAARVSSSSAAAAKLPPLAQGTGRWV